MFLSFLYFVLLIPILIYYRALMRNSEASGELKKILKKFTNETNFASFAF